MKDLPRMYLLYRPKMISKNIKAAASAAAFRM